MGGEDPAGVAAAAATADVHPFLCAVAHRTGDLSLLREAFEPDQAQLLVPGRGLGPAEEAEARALAVAALTEHLASGRPDHRLTPDERRRIFGFLVGAEAAAHWDGFLTEELALPGSDPGNLRGARPMSRVTVASAVPSSEPAPRAWRRRTGCARPASR